MYRIQYLPSHKYYVASSHFGVIFVLLSRKKIPYLNREIPCTISWKLIRNNIFPSHLVMSTLETPSSAWSMWGSNFSTWICQPRILLRFLEHRDEQSQRPCRFKNRFLQRELSTFFTLVSCLVHRPDTASPLNLDTSQFSLAKANPTFKLLQQKPPSVQPPP